MPETAHKVVLENPKREIVREYHRMAETAARGALCA